MFENILGGLCTCLDGLSGVILAVTVGFASVPTALVFLISAAGMLVFHQVTPFSVQSEVVLTINKLTKKQEERQSIVLYAGIIMLILGTTGIMGIVVDFIGDTILMGVMAGVGVMLVRISMEMATANPLPGYVAIGVAILMYVFTGNLIYTISVSVTIAAIVWNIYRVKNPDKVKVAEIDIKKDKFKFCKPTINFNIVRGFLAVATLMIGSAISDATVTNNLAGTTGNINALTGYLGVANIVSGLLGGAPAGIIISGTATAPDPYFTAILFACLMAAILLLKFVPVIMRFIPSQGMAGFLLTLGMFVVLPDNAIGSLSGQPMVGAITIMGTAFVDPFVGMCAGVLMRFLLMALGAM